MAHSAVVVPGGLARCRQRKSKGKLWESDGEWFTLGRAMPVLSADVFAREGDRMRQ
jgi:hypothetical protein